MDQSVSGAPGGFKDRQRAIVVVGVLVVAVGCVCALFAGLVGLVALVVPASVASPRARVLPRVLMYAALAVMFIWLGIGSIRLRRWARALLLILSWFWLLSGVVGVAAMAVLMPKALAARPPGGQGMPPGFATAFMVGMLVVMSVIFVLLPGLLVLFYRSRHVKATCEARDPVTRWTDACPLPVLAVSLTLAFGAVSMLAMVVPYHGVVPLFGRLVNGIPGGAILIAMAALWAYAARATYRLEPRGWWIVLIGFGVWAISAVVTFARVDPLEMYRMMGYSAEELAQLEQFGGLFGHGMLLLVSVAAVPWLGYLLFVKRYFRRPA